MLCPVCKKEYSTREIESHVDLCMPSFNANPKASSHAQKRPLLYEEADKTNPFKKHKTYPVISPGLAHEKVKPKEHVPLAEKMRPMCLDDYIGQEQLIGPNTVLQQLLTKGHIPSIILWGPSGCGKSSLANIISLLSKKVYGDKVYIVKLSATSSGVNTIRDAVKKAKNGLRLNCQTILFMDEIHRFNKLQQDIFLPHVEAGTFTLIGTTTENPSYSLNSALLSRCRVFVLKKLTSLNLVEILNRAISTMRGGIYDPQKEKLSSESEQGNPDFIVNKKVIDWLAEVCDGDARVALNTIELLVKSKLLNRSSSFDPLSISVKDVKESLKQAHMLCDKQTNNTSDLYSAIHKSIKAGNANAALYWLARIMALKEDPVNISRRLVRISSEDVGLADPDALGVAVHAMHSCQMIGMPECDVLLGQCVVYLAKAPKSRAVYNALKLAEDTIINHNGPQPSVPLHIRDRSGQGKLKAIFGRGNENLLRKDKTDKTYLPTSLQHVNFFLEQF